jgi:hypothetical protein
MKWIPCGQVGPFDIGRGDRIRTCDLVDPNHALYQSELHPETRTQMLVLARYSEPSQLAESFLENGFGKRGERGKRLICLALSEARSVRKAPQACNGTCDFPKTVQTPIFNGMPDHCALLGASVLHCVYQRESGFTLRQVIAEVFPKAGFVSLVIKRVVDQLERGTNMPTVACQRLLEQGRCVAQNRAYLCPRLK